MREYQFEFFIKSSSLMVSIVVVSDEFVGSDALSVTLPCFRVISMKESQLIGNILVDESVSMEGRNGSQHRDNRTVDPLLDNRSHLANNINRASSAPPVMPEQLVGGVRSELNLPVFTS